MMKTRATFVLCCVIPGIALGCTAEEPTTPTVELTLRAERDRIRPDDPALVHFTLKNAGTEPVSLVRPGDGSDVGWRTPILEWSVTNRTNPEAKPRMWGRCGNINPLGPGEVFTLRRGQLITFTAYVHDIPFDPAPGTYDVTLTYTNDPKMQWGGEPLGMHSFFEMRRVRSSTPVSVTSNTVTIHVSPSDDEPPTSRGEGALSEGN